MKLKDGEVLFFDHVAGKVHKGKPITATEAQLHALSIYREALEKIDRMTDGIDPSVIDYRNSLRWAKNVAANALAKAGESL